MQKREREALREYVYAVCRFSEAQELSAPDPRALEEPKVSIISHGGVRTLSRDAYRIEVADHLKVADDRLRALGMLP